MKRLITLALAVLLVLCGCAPQPEPSPAPTEPPTTDPIAVTQPMGLYDAGSDLEISTGGALKVYPLNRTDCIGLACMGEDLLLFSGAEITTLTKLSGENRHIAATANLNCGIYPSDVSVQVSDQGVTYYDERQNQLIFLDAQLKEIKKVSLPESICGAPALTADRQKLYYCTGEALRCLDLQSGLDRLLKEMYFKDLTLTALHCNDTVIVCDAEDADGNQSQLYICTETGQLLNETFGDVSVWTCGSFYFATHQDGIYQELLIGDSEQGPTLLTPHTYNAQVHPAVEMGGAVLVAEDAAADTLRLDYYDLRSGKRTAALTLKGREPIFNLQAAADGQALWFLRYEPLYQCEVLHCWFPEKSPVADEALCLSARYTAENPDIEGLAACQKTADALSEKYGVQILLWEEATAFQPWDYTLVSEYQVPVIREELKELEESLSLYPAGFLKKAAENTECGMIRICLVRSILGNESAEGALNEVVGLQYWDNANAYLSLAADQERLMQNACHEIFHIVESRVMTKCKAYDEWNKLNPAGFLYDNDYITNLLRNDYQWTEGENRAFIDIYSMSYPKEDRARIMEYAVMPGNEDCFESEIMQKKLRQLCLGIREAFGLKKSTEVFLWEQYLKAPLNQK